MKNLILLLSIILSFGSCSQNEENKTQDDSIIGTWKLTSSFINTTGNDDGEWKPIENGYIYKFNSDGSFESSRFDECIQGTYSLSEVKLTMNYGCSDFNSGFHENPKGILVESYRFSDNELILSPQYILCENCSFKFQKLEE